MLSWNTVFPLSLLHARTVCPERTAHVGAFRIPLDPVNTILTFSRWGSTSPGISQCHRTPDCAIDWVILALMGFRNGFFPLKTRRIIASTGVTRYPRTLDPHIPSTFPPHSRFRLTETVSSKHVHWEVGKEMRKAMCGVEWEWRRV
jgi:hypothetical protein